MANLWLILLAAISYLLGSIPTAYWVAGKEVMKDGSGNIGAMNTQRVTGSKKLMLLVLLIDSAKAGLAMVIARWLLIFLGYQTGWALMTVSFFVVLGHNYSLYIKLITGKFKGGRGIACLIGILFVLNWVLLLICFLVVVLVILITEYLEKRKLSWHFRNLFSVVGSNILGRVIGMVICLAPAYLLTPPNFFPSWLVLPILPAILLSFLAHYGRLREYLKKEGVKNNGRFE